MLIQNLCGIAKSSMNCLLPRAFEALLPQRSLGLKSPLSPDVDCLLWFSYHSDCGLTFQICMLVAAQWPVVIAVTKSEAPIRHPYVLFPTVEGALFVGWHGAGKELRCKLYLGFCSFKSRVVTVL